MKTRFAVALLTGLAVSAGCDIGVPVEPRPPCGLASGISIRLETFASDGAGSLMMVGDSGTAAADVVCSRGQSGGDVEDASVTSSDPAVVSVDGTALRAHALGSAVIFVRSKMYTPRPQGFVDSATVQVVASAGDRIQVFIDGAAGFLWDATDIQYDSLRSLTAVSVPLHGYVYPSWRGFRNNQPVWWDSVTVSSADPSVAVATAQCRPKELDATCRVVGSGWWVTGMGVGATEVSVSVRGLRATFTVKVF